MSTENNVDPGDALGTRPSTRDLADLARAGLEITRQPLTKVDFEIHHLPTRPGYVRTLLPTSAAGRPETGDREPRTAFLETLISGANGVDMVIGTRTRGPRESIPVPAAREGRSNPIPPAEVDGGGRVFRQTAWPNPTFIYESARTYEGLIAIDPASSVMANWHGAAIRDLVEAISRAATDITAAPLLTLQSPAQLPPTPYTGNRDIRSWTEGSPQLPSAIAVRFSIALQKPSAAEFFALSDRIRELCQEHRFGLWLKDTRPGHRSGNWFEISRAGRNAGQDYRQDSRSGEPITACLPVTCVGPARVGSTLAIASFLRRYGRVGVVSCAGTTLDDLGLVHLQLSVRDFDAQRLNRVLPDMAGTRFGTGTPQTYLAELFRRFGARDGAADNGVNGSVTSNYAASANDYQVFVGPAVEYRPPDATDLLAVWVSWQASRTPEGLAGPLECLYKALDQVVPTIDDGSGGEVPLSTVANIEYLICRATERSVIRGKGKLSMPRHILQPFQDAGVEAPASRLCATLEQAWKVQVDLAKVSGIAELTVAWRESWLGHWTFD